MSSDELVELHGHKGEIGYNLLHSPNTKVRARANALYEKARRSGRSALEAQFLAALQVPGSHVAADHRARSQGKGDVLSGPDNFSPVGSDRFKPQPVGTVVGRTDDEVMARVSGVEHGIEFHQHRDDKLRLTPADREAVASAMRQVLDRHPQMRVPYVAVEDGTDVFATNLGDHGISVAPLLFDEAALEKARREWYGIDMKGQARDAADVRRIVVVHELGHNIQNQLERLSSEARDEVRELVSEKVTYESLGYTSGFEPGATTELWKSDSLRRSSDGVSQSVYANENAREFFAEAYTDAFLNGDAASETGKRVMAIVEKYLGGSGVQQSEPQRGAEGEGGASEERAAADLTLEPGKSLGFTGTQGGMTDPQRAKVAEVIATLAPVAAHHGDDRGADSDFHALAEAAGVPTESHPPDNSSKRGFNQATSEHPAKPYMVRNQDIADASDVLVATPRGDAEELRSGTWSTIRRAIKAGKTVLVVQPDGSLWRAEGKPVQMTRVASLKTAPDVAPLSAGADWSAEEEHLPASESGEAGVVRL